MQMVWAVKLVHSKMCEDVCKEQAVDDGSENGGTQWHIVTDFDVWK